MSQAIWVSSVVLMMACGSKESTSEDQAEDTGVLADASTVPLSCSLDSQVCASYSSDWSDTEASEHCADRGGTQGACPADALGTCVLESGLTYHLYAMPARDAEGHCDWLAGEWVDAEA